MFKGDFKLTRQDNLGGLDELLFKKKLQRFKCKITQRSFMCPQFNNVYQETTSSAFYAKTSLGHLKHLLPKVVIFELSQGCKLFYPP